MPATSLLIETESTFSLPDESAAPLRNHNNGFLSQGLFPAIFVDLTIYLNLLRHLPVLAREPLRRSPAPGLETPIPEIPDQPYSA